MDNQRRLKDEKEQEAFQAQDQLIVMQEEVVFLKNRLDMAEEERKVLTMNLDKEEIAKAASEGSIALPSLPDGDEFASPRKRRRGDRESLKENFDPEAPALEELDEELMALKEDLRLEKRLRTQAEEATHFLKMECQFGVCSCRIAEQKGTTYVHDNHFGPQIPQSIQSRNLPPQSLPQPATIEEIKPELPSDPAIVSSPNPSERPGVETITSNDQLHFSPNSGTFSKHPSPTQPAFPQIRGGDASPNPSMLERQHASPPTIPATTHAHPLPPRTPRPLPNPPPRTISHIATTTIPLKADDPVFSPAPDTPGGISREEALERIRQRRGRARSFAVGIGGTPGRGSVRENREGEGRVISAPVGSRRK